MKFNILFLGTPEFAIPILERLHEEHTIIAVVTQPDKPVGRKQVMTPPPVKRKAEELGLTVLQPEKVSAIPKLIEGRIDFIVTAAYGQYLPTKVLELPFKEALNVHPSLLPLYRGATPMQSALLNGDKKTGVSIIRMVKEMDAGPIFNQIQFPLPMEWKYPDLEKECSEKGAELLLNVINNINSLSPQDQLHTDATFCSKITKQDGEVNWSEETAQEIFNKLRAFTPWPGVYTWWKNQKLSLLEFKATDYRPPTTDHSPGTIFSSDGRICITCKEGTLELQTLQLAGKNPIDIKAFTNGYQDFIGAQLSN